MKLGQRGFLPSFAITLFGKQIDDKLELIVRPVRTPNQQIYEGLQFDKLGEMLNNAFKSYCESVWGMTPIDEKEEARISGSDAMFQWGHLFNEGEDLP